MRQVGIGLVTLVVALLGLVTEPGFASESESELADTTFPDPVGQFVSDFDGDGFSDLAIGVPFANVGTVGSAGAVQVHYGSSDGLTESTQQVWTQDTSGIFGVAEPLDYFGFSIAVADFNGDGFGDLAIGVPGEDIGSIADSGGVHILYGSLSGLKATRSQWWTQNSSGVIDEPDGLDEFGTSLVAANFGKSAHADLAIGVPAEQINTVRSGGGVNIIYGSTNGLTGTGSQFWSQDSAGIFGVAENGDRFGSFLAAANFGRSSHADLVIGVPEALGGIEYAGGVHVIYGSVNGITATGSQWWTQNSTGIFGEAERFDEFGTSLAAANFGKSSHADLAIGVRSEGAGATSGIGGVHVIYGSTNGLSSSGSQFWNQNSTGILDEGEAGDNFGLSLTAGNFGKGSAADLAVGAPSEDLGSVRNAGAVHILFGSTSGLTGTNSQFWTQDSPGIYGEIELGDEFGACLAAANFGKSPQDDLAIGIPFESLDEYGTPQVTAAGAVPVIYGTADGLTGADSDFWTDNDKEEYERFGASLAAGNL